ncbi:MAG TPA: hypothetical protein VLC93_12910 [Myxococcota bacterium]|nr:hypothetical protein [Myxococcota bacterium]
MTDSLHPTPRRLTRLAAALFLCTPLWDCASDGLYFVNDTITPPENTVPAEATLPPLASAGPDREVLRGYRTQLDATGTWSLDDTPLTLSWQQTSGQLVYLSNPNDAAPYFIAPLDEQVLRFVLTVTNGAFTVKDEVVVAVKNEPRRIAPVVNGGPDQVGDALDIGSASPTIADDGTEITWQEVTPDRAALAAHKTTYNGPRIYKLVGVRDGLMSGPDYVLVHAPADDSTAPPVSSVEGPTQAATGSAITLAASGQAESGKHLSYHWEQTRGAPVLQTLGTKSADLDIEIPRVSQQLRFRVHAFDGLLASAPSEIILEVVPGDGLHPGQLVPGSDVRARPGSQVALKASTSNATPGALLAWQQTRGTTVDFDQSDDHIVFPTPGQDDELAFVVSSTIDDAESDPAAYRIVVTSVGNSAPRITACVPEVVSGGDTVEVSLRITDPDGDGIEQLTALVEGSGANEVPDGMVIGECATAPSAAVGSTITRVYTVDVPLSGTIDLDLTAVDALGAERNLTVTIAP